MKTHLLKVLPLLIILVGLLASCSGSNKSEPVNIEEEWRTLFNGKDMDNWRIKIAKHDLLQIVLKHTGFSLNLNKYFLFFQASCRRIWTKICQNEASAIPCVSTMIFFTREVEGKSTENLRRRCRAKI